MERQKKWRNIEEEERETEEEETKWIKKKTHNEQEEMMVLLLRMLYGMHNTEKYTARGKIDFSTFTYFDVECGVQCE